MRKNNCGKVFGRHAFRQSQISRNLQPIRRLVVHRLHVRKVCTREFFPHLILQLELVVFAVEEVGLTRLGIAVGRHQPDLLVQRGRIQIHFLARKLPVEPFEIGAKTFVLEVVARLVFYIQGERQLVGCFVKEGPAEIHFLQRIGFHDLRFPRFRIEQGQSGQVHVGALVGLHVSALAVFLKTDHAASFKNVAGIDLGEFVGIHAKNFRVAVLCGARSQPQIALQIELPAFDAFGVLAHQGLLAGRDLELVKVVPGFVAVIQPDVNHVRIIFWNIDKFDAYALQAGQIARRRSVRAFRRFGAGIHGIDVVVFVAVIVFYIQNVFAVTGPEESGDRPLGFCGQQPRGAERFIHALHINVACVFPRLLERQILSVGRNLGARDFRISEDQLAVDNRRQAAVGSRAFAGLRCER